VDTLRAAVGDPARRRIPPHLTLVPPVNVQSERLRDAIEVVRDAAAGTRPFAVRLGPPTTFLPDTPVLYLPVSGEDDAASVQALRDRVFQEPLARPLSWPFVPHVTLAEGLSEQRLRAAVTALADCELEVTFERVHLLHQQEHAELGRVWVPTAEVAFEAPAIVGRGGLPLELSVTGRVGADAEAFSRREWVAFDAAEFGAEAVEDGATVAITARRDGRIVGVARGQLRFGTAHLSELIVAAAVRGEGVGSHVLRAFESHAAEAGCHRLTVHTAAGSAAEAFYHRHGFHELQRLPEWAYGRDFVRLERRL